MYFLFMCWSSFYWNNPNHSIRRGIQMVVLSGGIFFAIIIAVLAGICFSNDADIIGIILFVLDAAVIGALFVCANSVLHNIEILSARC